MQTADLINLGLQVDIGYRQAALSLVFLDFSDPQQACETKTTCAHYLSPPPFSSWHSPARRLHAWSTGVWSAMDCCKKLLIWSSHRSAASTDGSTPDW